MIQRFLADSVVSAMADTPVVMLQGPRQCGKSTLVRWLAEHRYPASYFSLDDAAVLSAVSRDPEAFLHAASGPIVIDEVQLAPDLFRAIKLDVDRERVPGRVLLTGSANVLLLPRVSESLAGRMQILTLWPFSVGELRSSREGFVDRLFGPAAPGDFTVADMSRQELLTRIVTGGYPEVTQRPTPARRHAWFGSYITTILQRDVRAMADIEGLTELPRLLSVLAAQSGGMLNIAELSRDVGFSQFAIKRYITLLQATHLFQPLSAWSGNARKRLTKAPKVYLDDTGLLTYLLGLELSQLSEPSRNLGMLLEAFVYQELRKQIEWSVAKPSLHYFRTASGREVDFVLERRNGQIVGIEVKAAVKLGPHDFKGLDELADTVGERFRAGMLLYQGTTIVPFGRNRWAVPIGALFTG